MRTLLLDGDRNEAAVALKVGDNVTALRRVPYSVVRSASGDYGHYDRDYKANQMTVRIFDAMRKKGAL